MRLQGGPETGVFWFDLTTLSPQTKAIYSLFVIGLFSLVIFLMVRKVLLQPEDPTKNKRKKVIEKREKRSKSKAD